MNSSISMLGPTWWFEMNASAPRPDRRSMAAMNLCCMAFWKALRVSWTIVARCSSIIVFSMSGVDASEYARGQVASEQQCLRGHRGAVGVTLV